MKLARARPQVGDLSDFPRRQVGAPLKLVTLPAWCRAAERISPAVRWGLH